MNTQGFVVSERLAYSPPELSRVTGLSIATIYRKLASREIASSRLGRRILIPSAELERLLRPQEAAA